MQASPALVAPVAAGAVLHAGCGGRSLPPWLAGDETRLDIDQACEPDICASMTDLGDIGPFDIVYTCHALEHLDPDEALQALREFRRVLKDGGALICIVPDCEGVEANDDVLFEAACGPITGRDLIEGHHEFMQDSPYMAHRQAFTRASLEQAFREAGFRGIGLTRGENYNLIGCATK